MIPNVYATQDQYEEMRFSVIGALENESLRDQYYLDSTNTTHGGLRIDFDSDGNPVIGFGYDLYQNRNRINTELVAYLDTNGLTQKPDGSYEVPQSAMTALATYMSSNKQAADRTALEQAWSQLQIATVADARELLETRMDKVDEAIDIVTGNATNTGSPLLANSKEKIALIHLLYNTLDSSQSSQKIASDIQTNNPSLSNILENQQDDPSFRASLWCEMKFFSNKGEKTAVQNARNNAAKLIGLFDQSGLPDGWMNAMGPLIGGNRGTAVAEPVISSQEEAKAVAFLLNNERRLAIITKISQHTSQSYKTSLTNDFKNSIKKCSDYLLAQNSQYFEENQPNADDLNLIIGSNGKYQYDDKSLNNALIPDADNIDMKLNNQYTDANAAQTVSISKNDLVFLQEGDDEFHGGEGNDYIFGEKGVDHLYGDDGDDYLIDGGDEENYLYGGRGDDTIIVNGDNNTIYGGDVDQVYDAEGDTDDDTITVVGKNNAVYGGAGVDTITITGDGNVVFGGNAYEKDDGERPATLTGPHWYYDDQDLPKVEWEDEIAVLGNNNFIFSGDGNDFITILAGSSGNNVYGGEGIDFIVLHGNGNNAYGGSGDDVLASIGESNFLYGGYGLDRYFVTSGGFIGEVDESSSIEFLIYNSGYAYLAVTFGSRDIIRYATNSYSDINWSYSVTGESQYKVTRVSTGEFFTLHISDEYAYDEPRKDHWEQIPGEQTLLLAPDSGEIEVSSSESGDPIRRVIMEGGITSSGVETYRTGNDLSIVVKNSTSALLLSGFFDNEAQYQDIEIKFSDGTVWNFADIDNYATVLNGQGITWTGSAADDTQYGTALGDTLRGVQGNDTLHGGNGDDWLEGGAGNDILIGGKGSDTYYFERGWGQDVIEGFAQNDATGIDSIQFANDILPSDIVIVRDGVDVLVQLKGSTDQIRVRNFFGFSQSGTYQLQEIHFANGTIWGHADIQQQALHGTDSNDFLYGYDTNDNLYGGLGNDYLEGGGGSDTYHFERGWGQDIVNNYDVSPGRKDIIRFGAGIAASEIDVFRDLDDLVIRLRGTLDQITVKNYFSNNHQLNPDYQIDEIQFADGTVWNPSLINEKIDDPIIGTDADDILYGTPNADVIYGGFGNDQIYGGDGNDILYGETGNDNINGGNGNDIIYGGHNNDTLDGADGDDTLYGEAGNDILKGGNGNDILYGDTGDDTLNGGSGNDILYGGDGKDTLYGNALYSERGQNTLVGGFGDDFLMIGRGEETYVFERGWGKDIMSSHFSDLGADKKTLRFGAGITIFDIELDTISSPGDLIIKLKDGTDQIFIRYYFSMFHQKNVPLVMEFIDGTQWDMKTLLGLQNVENVAPVTYGFLDNLEAKQGELFRYVFSADLFADADGDALTYSVFLVGLNGINEALPSWLTFDAATRTLSGIPENGEYLNLRLVATDTKGLSASHSIGMNIEAVVSNQAPVAQNQLSDLYIARNEQFNFTIPAGTFTDPDEDTLTYSARLVNGDELPEWLSFDPATGTFQGPPDVLQDLEVIITANDGNGHQVSSALIINVKEQVLTGSTANTITTSNNAIYYEDGVAQIQIRPGAEHNYIVAGSTPNSIQNYASHNTFVSGNGNDYIESFRRTPTDAECNYVTIDAGDGDDQIMSNGSFNTFLGGAGNDRFVYAQSFFSNVFESSKLYGGEGVDQFQINGFSIKNLTVMGEDGNDRILFNGMPISGGQSNSDNLFDGGEGNDLIDIYAGGERNTIRGGSGDDVIAVRSDVNTLLSTNNSIIDGGTGNDDMRSTGNNDDTYLFRQGDGYDIVFDNGGNDVFDMIGINRSQATFTREDNDLMLSYGQGDLVRLKSYYAAEGNRIETINFADGALQIDALVSAMAAFAPPAAGQTSLTVEQQAALAPVIAANWQ